MKKRIILTVTNDLVFDQRMQRICESLQKEYAIELIGRLLPGSPAVDTKPYLQTRLKCFFNKEFLFYAEFNLRLLFYLLRFPFDIVCGCDLDTLPAAVIAGKIKRKKIVYDAHEYFPESPELVNRKVVKKIWQLIEKAFVPLTDLQYTVCDSIAQLFIVKYKKPFEVIRNLPYYTFQENINAVNSRIILYQGAVNVGRGIKEMIAAMKLLPDFIFYIAGDGDILEDMKKYVRELQLQDKIKFTGKLKPHQLKQLTDEAFIGVNILENMGLSYYYSLGNKTFDYIQSDIPQVLISFPEYKKINNEYAIGVLVNDMDATTLTTAILSLKENPDEYKQIQLNCGCAAKDLCWENEEIKLRNFYKNLL